MRPSSPSATFFQFFPLNCTGSWRQVEKRGCAGLCAEWNEWDSRMCQRHGVKWLGQRDMSGSRFRSRTRPFVAVSSSRPA